MTEEKLEALIHATIKEAVKETLSSLGINTENIHETQQTFLFLYRMRKGSEDISNAVRKTAIGLAVSGFLYLIWEAFKLAMSR